MNGEVWLSLKNSQSIQPCHFPAHPTWKRQQEQEEERKEKVVDPHGLAGFPAETGHDGVLPHFIKPLGPQP